MNKNLIIGSAVAVVVIAAGTGTYFALNNKSSEGSSQESKSVKTEKKLTAIKACELLTLAEAKQLMGESATEGSNTGPTSSNDINVDTCSYINNATSVPSIRTITVMARSALTNDGLGSNKEAFDTGGAANQNDAIAVDGYGEKAYWDPTTHQLAILDGNTWIGIVYGGTNPANNTLDDAKKVADLIK